MNEREAMLYDFERIHLAATVGALTIDGYRNAIAQCRELAEAALDKFGDDGPEVAGRIFRRRSVAEFNPLDAGFSLCADPREQPELEAPQFKPPFVFK